VGKLRLLTILALAGSLLAAAPAWAQRVEQFYRGRVVQLYIGFSVGGGYDVYGRLVARHIGNHIPGRPTVVPINMEGAGSVKAANWLYNVAPRDGSVIGIINRGVPFEPLVGNVELTRFDAAKFTWIGSTTNETGACVAHRRTGIRTFDETYEKELIVGGTGPGADDHVYPKLIAGVLGAKLRLVTGYAGGNDVDFAMERGEVDGRCGWSWSSIKSTRSHWLTDGTIVVFLQLALKRHADLPDVPVLIDLARSEEERQILELVLVRGALGRPFLAPPGVPPERAATLRKAFDDMVRDPRFLADAERLRLEITPIGGEELQAILERTSKTPPEIAAKARAVLQGGL
jgi:tripartite-type tricarboxylate transporter receptor subunit TctC